MVHRGIKTPAILFVQSKARRVCIGIQLIGVAGVQERAQQLFHEMIYDGLNVDLIHSERTKAQREAVVDKFRSGKVASWIHIRVRAKSWVASHVTRCHTIQILDI